MLAPTSFPGVSGWSCTPGWALCSVLPSSAASGAEAGWEAQRGSLFILLYSLVPGPKDPDLPPGSPGPNAKQGHPALLLCRPVDGHRCQPWLGASGQAGWERSLSSTDNSLHVFTILGQGWIHAQHTGGSHHHPVHQHLGLLPLPAPHLPGLGKQHISDLPLTRRNRATNSCRGGHPHLRKVCRAGRKMRQATSVEADTSFRSKLTQTRTATESPDCSAARRGRVTPAVRCSPAPCNPCAPL